MLLSQVPVRCIILVLTFSSYIQGQQQNSCGCVDIPPPGIDCAHQKYTLGNCESQWILSQNYCAVTCDRCICSGDCQCTDIPPESTYSCKELQFYEKCDEKWILDGKHCEYSCGRCSCLQDQGQRQGQRQVQQIRNTSSLETASPYTVAPMPTVVLSQGQGSDSLPLTQPLPFTPIPQISQQQQQQQQPPCDQEFLNILGSNPDTMYLVDLLQNSPLLTLFQVANPEPYTLFMPNYYSWKNFMATLSEPQDLLIDQILMLQLLGTHMVKGAYAYPELARIGVLKTMMKDVNIYAYLQGAQLVIGVGYKEVFRVSNIAMQACNSVIYVLNGVLIDENSRINDMFAVTPHFLNLVVEDFVDEDFDEDLDESPEMEYEYSEEECEDINALEIINKHPQLKIISQLVDKAEMRDILGKSSKQMTLFMPMDEADFNVGDAGQQSQAALLQLDPMIIKDIVRYHIVQGELVDLRDINGSKQLTTLSDNRIVTLQASQQYYTLKGQSYSANIVDENIGNGCSVMVHMLDRVLMPYSPEQARLLYPSSPSPSLVTAQFCSQTVWSVISGQQKLSILNGVENRVDPILTQNDRNMTIFLPDARGQDQITILAEELASTLESANDIAYDLILYHIVANAQLNLKNDTGIGKQDTLADLPIQVTKEANDFYVSGTASSAKVIQVGRMNPCNPVLVHEINGALFPFPKENSGTKGIPSTQELQKMQMSAANGASSKCQNNFTLLEYLQDEPRLSYLVEKAGDDLESMLALSGSKNGKTTYFFPVNDAFVELEKNQAAMEFLKEDKQLATMVLQYHAVPDKLISVNTIARMPIRESSPQVTSFNTITMTLRKQFGVLLTIGQEGIGRAIELSSYESCSTVVHLIDNVLLPFQISNTDPATTPAPAPAPSYSYDNYGIYTHQVSVNLANYDQYVEAQAVTNTVTRGESPLNSYLQVVNGAPPSPIMSSSLGSDISQFFPSSGGVVAEPVRSSEIQHCNKTIAAVMEQNDRLSQWARFMRLAGYANYLDQTNANITLVAPVSSAFDSVLSGSMNMSFRQLAADESQRELFVKIVSYHIIPYPVNVRDTPVGTSGSFGTLWFDDGGYQMQLKMRKFMEPFAQGETLVVEGIINNATVSGSPLNFCKAYIYPVDKVLGVEESLEEPAPAVVVQAPGPYRPIVDAGSLLPNVTISSCIKPLQIIQNQPDLSIFIRLVYYANINEVINGLERITIFAPTDLNLNQILNQFNSNLQDVSPQLIQNWMAYHIVTGEYTEDDLTAGVELESLTVDSQGNKMKLTVERKEDGNGIDEQIYIKGVFNEAYLVRTNLEACNAIIHIVSMPLLPVLPENN